MVLNRVFIKLDKANQTNGISNFEFERPIRIAHIVLTSRYSRQHKSNQRAETSDVPVTMYLYL